MKRKNSNATKLKTALNTFERDVQNLRKKVYAAIDNKTDLHWSAIEPVMFNLHNLQGAADNYNLKQENKLQD